MAKSMLEIAVNASVGAGHAVTDKKGAARIKGKSGNVVNFKADGQKGFFSDNNPLAIAETLKTAEKVVVAEKAGKADSATGFTQSATFNGEGASVAYGSVYDAEYGIPVEPGTDNPEGEKPGDVS